MMAICTGCSLLCEDIEVDFNEGKISTTKNLCRKGLGRYRSMYTERAIPRIDGREAGLDDAISRAAGLLKEAKRPLLFGWSNSTLEAQSAGLDLAQKLGAVIDDTSSFCQGELLEMVLKGELPSCTLDDVRNYADMIFYWGSDPSNSHPRHMSRFSYYPRGEKRQRGYDEDRRAYAIDVRLSPTASMMKEGFFKVAPGGDASFMESMLAALGGKIPRLQDKKKVIAMVNAMKRAEFGAIFPGLGLAYSMKGRMDILKRLVDGLNETSKFSVIPMVGHFNMRGFNQMLFEKTGFINRVSFADGVEHGPEESIIDASKSCDAALVIGSDPISALPGGLARSLAKIPTIVIDPHRTLTSELAQVTIPSALSGMEAGGSALRMDGVRIEFEPIVPENDLLPDLEILKRIAEAV